MYLNRITIIGYTGGTIEYMVNRTLDRKVYSNGVPICTLSVCTSMTYRNNQGVRCESKQWHRVLLKDKCALVANSLDISRGTAVIVEGYLDYYNYDGRKCAQIVATNIQRTDGKEGLTLEDASAKLNEIVADIDLNEDIIYDEDDYNLYGMDEIH